MNLLLLLKSKITLANNIKHLCAKLKVVRKERDEWKAIALEGNKTINKIQEMVEEAKNDHCDRIDKTLYY